jgi:hypothetical protein
MLKKSLDCLNQVQQEFGILKLQTTTRILDGNHYEAKEIVTGDQSIGENK